ncbi:TM2 domain-containing protein [Pseudomonas sp. PCH446]
MKRGTFGPRLYPDSDCAFSRNFADGAAASGNSKKIPAALLAFFLGAFGVHKFYLGYNVQGVIMLLVFLFD